MNILKWLNVVINEDGEVETNFDFAGLIEESFSISNPARYLEFTESLKKNVLNLPSFNRFFLIVKINKYSIFLESI